MPNMLTEEAPSSITVGGVSYKINTDFRVWIAFEQLLFGNYDYDYIISNVIELVFADELPPWELMETAWDEIINFYSHHKRAKSGGGKGKSKQIYDYDYDDEYIYAAFLSQYGIDLQDIKYLHWWKFKAMFSALSDDCKIVQMMSYRAVDIDGKMSKEQQHFYRKMKELYALPLPLDEEEKLKDIENALLNGENIEMLL